MMRIHAEKDSIFVLRNYLLHFFEDLLVQLCPIHSWIFADILCKSHLDVNLSPFEPLKNINVRRCVNNIERAISNRPLMYVVFNFGNILKAEPLVQNCYNCVDCHIVDEGLVTRARLQHMRALRWNPIEY